MRDPGATRGPRRGRTPCTIIALGIASFTLLLAGCDPDSAKPPPPAARLAADAQPPPQSGPELRFAVSAMLSPKLTYDAYADLFKAIADRLGYRYRFIQRRTYGEINELLVRGELDLAFICSGAFAAMPEGTPIDLIAIPVANGTPTYNSVLIVKTDSPYEKVEDLKGARFAFTDPMSNTGCVYPRYRFAQLGITEEEFFSRTTYTGSHDRSVMAVYRQIADAAAVDSLIYEKIVVPASQYWGRLRIIERSPPFPNPPVVAPTSTPEELRRRMRATLLNMGESAEGRRLLSATGIDRFIEGKAEQYKVITKMIETVQNADAAPVKAP